MILEKGTAQSADQDAKRRFLNHIRRESALNPYDRWGGRDDNDFHGIGTDTRDNAKFEIEHIHPELRGESCLGEGGRIEYYQKRGRDNETNM